MMKRYLQREYQKQFKVNFTYVTKTLKHFQAFVTGWGYLKGVPEAYASQPPVLMETTVKTVDSSEVI